MHGRLKEAILSALKTCGVEADTVKIEHPSDLSHGDYATGAALQYAKQAGIAPRALAERMVAALGRVAGIEKIEIAGPGFVNFRLSKAALGSAVEKARAEDMWGKNSRSASRKVMVEYTDPNPFKEFHIGHLMSNAIGESISRLLQFSSAEVKRANYQGDVGPHVAKAVWGLQKLGLDASSSVDLGKAYTEGAKAYEGDAVAKKEIDELNKKIYAHSDATVDALYARGREASLAHFEELYKILGTTFDFYFFESQSAPKGLQIVAAHPHTFEKSDGATVFKGEKVGLHTRVFVTSLGLPTYEAKDLGLAVLKSAAWQFDESITVTASEQGAYFQVVLAAMREVLPDMAAKVRHVTHGMMRFADGKMSSRTGNVITGESLIADLTAEANERAKESRSDDPKTLAQQVAVAAIKYQILKQSSGKDIIFDRERALSLEGDSGPYLQYAHARTHQIVERAKTEGIEAKADEADEFGDVGRLLVRFPDIVEEAVSLMEPHVLTTYLTALASTFNSWYSSVQILDGTPSSAHKVALTDAVRKTLKNGLWVLGIPAPEKM